MKQIMIQSKVMLWIAVFFLLGTGAVSAQGKTVSGTVTSAAQGTPLAGVSVAIKGTLRATVTGLDGKYKITVPSERSVLVFSLVGYKDQEITVKGKSVIHVSMDADTYDEEEVVLIEEIPMEEKYLGARDMKEIEPAYSIGNKVYEADEILHNTESYGIIHENIFLRAVQEPLSTFSIDVDAASYSNVRRFLNQGQRPPKDAVRIEEMINYFTYDYAQPKGEHPFSVHTEISSAPWNEKHRLVHIGLQGKKVATDNLPASNLVFLIDVSGSMESSHKLPLLKSAFRLLVEELRPQDRVSMVVYAGAAGLVLPPTPGDHKEKILQALNNLSAGGSTAGGAGIKLAYQIAKENYIDGGNNRVILATDGDFNIGASSDAEMERLIGEKKDEGVFLTALGFGMGNYKDSKMEALADRGDGNYAYIDNILEAKKVLVNEFGGTLFTIAKDVKLQVEFNPARVQAYRLIGYENRALKNEDFNNDKKDAGDLGSGHTVTALYEIIPVGVDSELLKVDDLRYQESKVLKSAYASVELMTVKFRYKKPTGGASRLMVHPVVDEGPALSKTSDSFRWSAAVAGFGMLLRDSGFKGSLTLKDALTLAEGAKGKDEEGYRNEFIHLMKSQELLMGK